MGIDTTIAAVNRPFSQENVVDHLEKFKASHELLAKDDSRYPFAENRYWLKGIEALHGFLAELDPPPSVNKVDLEPFYFGATGYPHINNSHCTQIYLSRNSHVYRKFAQYLESRSPEAAGLMYKLMGYWQQNQRNLREGKETYEMLEPPFEFYMNDMTYLVEPESNPVGYLQGKEIGHLATKLKPFIPEVPEFYDLLDQKYRRQAEQAAPIELVYSLATNYKSDHAFLMTYTG